MRAFSVAACFLFVAAALAQPAGPAKLAPAPVAIVSPRAEASVVKIFATVRAPELTRPWLKGAPHEISGSGVVIPGHRILTNAHVVTYASQIQVQPEGSGDRLGAKVIAVAQDMDMAILSLDDETFFDTHAPLPRTEALPHVKDSVLVLGFPVGGTSLSTTKGIVSRIEFAGYRFPASGLRIQIDAALNPGNSGGPVVADDHMIGLAFSGLRGNTQNIGYIIPCEEIRLFLDAVARGGYHGKPALYDTFAGLENASLRKFLKLAPTVHGVALRETDETSSAYPLKEWDVVTKIGTTPVDDQGNVTLGGDLHVAFRYLVQRLQTNGHIPVTIIRGTEPPREVQVPVSADRPRLVPFLAGKYPSYFIYGPITFTVVTEDFLGLYARTPLGLTVLSEVGNPMLTRRSEPPAFPGEQMVVVPAPFFPHKLTMGYPSPSGAVLASVNGTPVKSLAHLVALLRDAKGEFVTFKFSGRGNSAFIFNRSEIAAATDEILADNGVRSQGSPDMMAVWSPPAAP